MQAASRTGTDDFDASADRLVRVVALLGLPAAVILGIVALLVVDLWIGLAVLVVVEGAWAASVVVRVRGGVDRVVSATGARRLAEGEQPRWVNVVDGLCISGGLDEPELWLLDRAEGNAFAAAGGDRVVLAATTGLLEALSPVELEAVTANLLCRVKDGSARYGTVAAALVGPLLGGVDAAGRLLAQGLGDQRAVRSDLAAVGMTRYPPGLVAAFARLGEVGTEVPGVAPWTAHLWVAPVVAAGAGVPESVAGTAMQPLSLRMAVLDEL